MRTIIKPILLLLTMTTLTTQAQSNDRRQIKRLYETMYRAMIAKDTAALRPMFTDDFYLAHMTGTRAAGPQPVPGGHSRRHAELLQLPDRAAGGGGRRRPRHPHRPQPCAGSSLRWRQAHLAPADHIQAPQAQRPLAVHLLHSINILKLQQYENQTNHFRGRLLCINPTRESAWLWWKSRREVLAVNAFLKNVCV